MKKLLQLIGLLFILGSCHNKKHELLPLPDATFTVSVNNNNVATFGFTANKNDVYTFDFGDGERLTGILDYLADNEPVEHKHIYRKNGKFTVKLTLYRNKHGSDLQQKVVEARYASVADFSYEVLENGKLRLKNLSQNARYGHKWLIGDPSYNGSYWIYTSTEQDPVVDIDLNGRYKIRLEVPGEFSASMKEDTVYIKNARSQMTFSGLYQGKNVELPLDGSPFYYTTFVSGGVKEPYGLYQKLWKSANEREIFAKFYSFPNDNSANPPNHSNDAKYSFTRQNLTKEKDPDIIEVKEEYLNRKFYNANVHPIAFWVRYKIKNELLDGEMKVRIMIYGLH